MFCVGILFVNLELYAVKRLVGALTAPEGVYVKRSHAHRLFRRNEIGWTMCDRCHQRIRESWCYNCATCDWDVCYTCIRADLRKEKKLRERAELEGLDDDDGADEEEEITLTQYMRRGALFLRPHWLLVVGALLCLAVQNGARVMIPRYTGNILDSVVPGHDNTNGASFRASLTAFIAFNVVLGVMSGLSGLMFAIVSQRMQVNLRKTMFQRILSQSIDFFDNATTGDLLASLNDDVRNMLGPVQIYVPRLFGAVLTLAGGLVMCLQTSWRLSLLAFTILGPLTMVTSTYSTWASALWSRMWGINSSMTDTAKEAFSNIRTIRAVPWEHSSV